MPKLVLVCGQRPAGGARRPDGLPEDDSAPPPALPHLISVRRARVSVQALDNYQKGQAAALAGEDFQSLLDANTELALDWCGFPYTSKDITVDASGASADRRRLSAAGCA